MEAVATSGRRAVSCGLAVCRVVPAEAWIGLSMVLAGLFQLPVAFSIWHLLTLVGVALLSATSFRLASSSRGAADDAAIADGIERRVEELRDVVWELRESEARYRDLLDTQEHMIARRDSSGRLTYVNRSFCRLFGISPDVVLGDPWHPQVLAEDRARAEPHAGQRRRYIQLLDTANGPRWIAFEEHRVPAHRADHGTPSAIADAAGSSGGPDEVQIVGSDITESRAVQAELARARDQAQSADRAKSRFLAAMSHEIRTPMNGIMGMADLLGETPLSAEQRTYLGAIDQSASTLLLLIDEILDFSKIEAGKLELASQPFTFDACLQDAVELLAPAAHEKGLEIAWTSNCIEPIEVIGDASRVRQIMLNLIGNAVKYTDRGGVLVDIRREDDGLSSACISVAVKDTGIGLAHDAVGRLFAEFNQGDSEGSLRRGGTGLGLAISRRLARAMGGDITVDSEPGRGSVFTVSVTLPLARIDHRAELLPHEAASKKRVLLAFDKLIERKALAANLAVIGFGVIEIDASGAAGAIDEAAAHAGPVEFVVCDAEADPSEAAAALARAREVAEAANAGIEVRGILLLAPETRPSMEHFRTAGFSAYLVRPVRPRALLSRFGLDPGMAQGETSTLVPERDGHIPVSHSGQHVLLAEDNSVNALLATRMLEKSGCTVVHVVDGEQAIAAAIRSLDQGERAFDLILMDVHMPRLDGLAAATAIRTLAASHPNAGRLPPMVALTANAFTEDRVRCLAAGLDDYLAKPFHKSDLMALIARWGRRGDTGKAA